jgi:uncharacterized radical SAM superfamily Fe-S cluster-containing enzyme
LDRKAAAEQRKTFSICPLCHRRVPAVLRKGEDGCWRLHKSCDWHGEFAAVVWRGEPERERWTGDLDILRREDMELCPDACGLCAGHQQGTCCVLLEVTRRCNLACRFCFAEGGDADGKASVDPPLESVCGWIADIVRRGNTFLQLSGGEPSMRDDLPEIVRRARELGCQYVQLNSNGLRLAEDEAFADALAEAGLSFVFLQFDGLNDAIYTALRGKPLLEHKLRAIEHCGKRNIGVTLVPTLVPGVNEGAVGDILRFAVERSPQVRGVHFQPVSYFGRYPEGGDSGPDDSRRLTLPEVYQAIFAQAGELVPANSIVPSRCDHPACGFHGGYIVTPEGLKPLTPNRQPDCCSSGSAAERNRHFVGSRWQRPETSCCGGDEPCDLTTLDGFLNRARSHAFTISAMAFQDAWTLDLERLRRCSLHVYDQGRVVPFCSHYIHEL